MSVKLHISKNYDNSNELETKFGVLIEIPKELNRGLDLGGPEEVDVDSLYPLCMPYSREVELKKC
jgi:hypothetical protein